MAKIQLGVEQESAMKVLLGGKSAFVTGKAGAGKSTLISEFKKRARGKYIVIAPTGKAALNVDGATVHNQMSIPTSVFPFKSEPKRLSGIAEDKKKLLAAVDIIIVDEVSMVRSDLLEAMDQRMQHARGNRLPFGGVQMIFVGDFYQLPPVVMNNDKSILGEKIYAFQSPSWASIKPAFIELNEVHRQKNGPFLDALNRVRIGDKTAIHELNKYVRPPRENAVGITFTNAQASEINDRMLAALPGPVRKFQAKSTGAGVPGVTVPESLELKVGAQIITVVNGTDGEYVNGSVGTVLKLSPDAIQVRLNNSNKIVNIEPHTWDNMNWAQNKKGEIVLKSVGKFKQFPVLLAWAMTSHKLQGESLDVGHLTRGNGAFAHGQTYVALSRLRSEEGLSLHTPLQPSDIIVDRQVVEFMETMRKLNPVIKPTPVLTAPEAPKPAPSSAVPEVLPADIVQALNDVKKPSIEQQLNGLVAEEKTDPTWRRQIMSLVRELMAELNLVKQEVAEVEPLREQVATLQNEVAGLRRDVSRGRSPSP